MRVTPPSPHGEGVAEGVEVPPMGETVGKGGEGVEVGGGVPVPHPVTEGLPVGGKGEVEGADEALPSPPGVPVGTTVAGALALEHPEDREERVMEGL